jgi:putative DNA primase/helicase
MPTITDRRYLAEKIRELWTNAPLRFYRGEFYEYENNAYRSVRQDTIRQFVAISLDDYFNSVSDFYRKPLLTTSLIRDVLLYLEHICAVPSVWDLPAAVEPAVLTPLNDFYTVSEIDPGAYPDMAVFQNGLLNLDDLVNDEVAKVYKPHPAIMSVNAFAFAYDKHAMCPNWMKTVHRIFDGDQERIAILQEVFGYCLRPGNPLQRFFLFDGPAKTGKSTTANMLVHLLGRENVSHVPLDLFAERFQLGPTIGKLANISADPSHINPRVTAVVKQFTGEDTLHIDRKGIAPFSAAATGKVIILANQVPEFVDPSKGVWRRLVRVRFTSIIDQADYDPHIGDKLQLELPGIFNWAVEGFRRINRNEVFTLSTASLEAGAQAEREQDALSVWLADHVQADPTGVVSSQQLYRRYVDAMEQDRDRAVSKHVFNKVLRGKFPMVDYHRHRVGKELEYAWIGIAWTA